MKKRLGTFLAIGMAMGISISANAAESLGGESLPLMTAGEANIETLVPAILDGSLEAAKLYEKNTILASLYEADITTLREALDKGIITSRELTQYYLERIGLYNPTFNCFVTICDNALEEADKRDALMAAGMAQGRLFGIPVVVKDNIEYAGYYTTNGYSFKSSKISGNHATIVQYLLNEGAVIIGKTNMSTQAQDARKSYSKAVGNTYNAYNPDMAPGGSSGGSAVATSLNFAAASLGTDTNSSLRYPAALNGCVSLRPTFGLISKDGVITLNKRRDTPGAITRTVKDQAIMLSVINNFGDFEKYLDANALQGARIGVLKELCGATKATGGRTESTIDVEVMQAFQNTLWELELCGAEIVEVSMPNIFKMSSKCAENISGWQKAKENYYEEYKRMFVENNISAVVFPTYLNTPLQLKKVSDFYGQTYITNCNLLSSVIGVPEISVPIGVHSRGAGMGIEIASLKYSEQLLLNLAYSYTEKFNHRQVPSLAEDIYRDFKIKNLSDFILEKETGM